MICFFKKNIGERPQFVEKVYTISCNRSELFNVLVNFFGMTFTVKYFHCWA